MSLIDLPTDCVSEARASNRTRVNSRPASAGCVMFDVVPTSVGLVPLSAGRSTLAAGLWDTPSPYPPSTRVCSAGAGSRGHRVEQLLKPVTGYAS